jgi:hypothetical protein
MIHDILGDSPIFRRFFERICLFDPDRNVDQIRNLDEVIENVLDRDVVNHHSIMYEFFVFHCLPFYTYVVENYL